MAGLGQRTETPTEGPLLKMANISTLSLFFLAFGSVRVYAQEEGTCWRWLEQKAAYQREHYPKEATISDLAVMPMYPALHTWTCVPRSHPEADWGAGPRIRTG